MGFKILFRRYNDTRLTLLFPSAPKRLIFILLSVLAIITWPSRSYAQLCPGISGSVVYLENFGAGSSSNAQSPVPPSGITTTYQFVASGNITAGQYGLYTDPSMANAAWYYAPNSDHTQNGNGYMVLIDALPNNQGVFFEKLIDAPLCTGVTYEFSAWVANVFPDLNGIPPNVTFEIRDAVNNTLLGSIATGNISYGASQIVWNQYGLLITAPASGNPIKLRLLNNYGGSDSWGNDLAIDDISLRVCGPQLTVTTPGNSTGNYCVGQQATIAVTMGGGAYTNPQYQWQSSFNGTTWTDIAGANSSVYTSPALTVASPTYYRVVVAQWPNITSANCQTISDSLQIDIFSNPVSTILLSLCQTQLPYVWNGITIPAGAVSNPAFTTYTTTSAAGCDSTVTLNLTVKPTTTATASLTLCSNQLPYVWNGITVPAGAVSNPAFTTYTTTGAAGCDSTVTLNLTVKPTTTATASLTLCSNQLPYVWNGITVPAGSVSNPAFTTYTTTGAAGCDSMVTLNLTVTPTATATASLTLCSNQLPYVWNGITIPAGAVSNPAFTTYTTTSAAGCDSTVTLNLTVKPTTMATASLTLCSNQLPYVWNGITVPAGAVSNPAFTTYTTTGAAGCDSTVTLNLTVNPVVENNFTETICAGEEYIFGADILTTSGVYSQTFTSFNTCDSIVTLVLKVAPNPSIGILPEGAVHYCLGDTITFRGAGAETYQWSWKNSNVYLGDGSTKTVILYTDHQEITVEGVDSNGCRGSADLIVRAEGCCQLRMPNAFSPNGDALNDGFGPETSGNPKQYAMRIYNRWGQMIFVSYKVGQKWDGTYGGQPATVGTYFYSITGECANGEQIELKGDITLLR
jgi:gliding motility-associated-like protein